MIILLTCPYSAAQKCDLSHITSLSQTTIIGQMARPFSTWCDVFIPYESEWYWPSRYANLPYCLTCSFTGMLSSLSSFLTSIQTVPPSATKYNSLNSADLYHDGKVLCKASNERMNNSLSLFRGREEEIIRELKQTGRRRQREEPGKDCISDVFETLHILILAQISNRFCQSFYCFIVSNYGRATVVISQNDAHVLTTT